MKNRKKTLALLLAGLMATVALRLAGLIATVALLGVAGCADTDDKPVAPDPTPAPSPAPAPSPEPAPAPAPASPLVGTWVLDYAHDFGGDPYDISDLGDAVKLVIRSETTATFHYFDDAPYEGELSREGSLDGTYPGEGCSSKGYRLTGSDGSYGEFLFVLPNDVSRDSFWYLEVGSSQPAALVLSRVVQ